MSVLIKVLKSEKEKSFNLKNSCFVGCGQALNRLKRACPQPVHPVSRVKKSYLLVSLNLPTLKALYLKAFKKNLDFKSELGGSSPKLTTLTHLV